MLTGPDNPSRDAPFELIIGDIKARGVAWGIGIAVAALLTVASLAINAVTFRDWIIWAGCSVCLVPWFTVRLTRRLAKHITTDTPLRFHARMLAADLAAPRPVKDTVHTRALNVPSRAFDPEAPAR